MTIINEIKTNNIPIKLWTDVTAVEQEALKQLENIALLPWVFKHVAVMPDVHYGKGATVGSVIAMKDAVSPAAVGVDIGCGMAAVKTNLKASHLPDSLSQFRSKIEQAVPVGFNCHKQAISFASHLWDEFNHLDKRVQNLKEKAMQQLGTLGGGNHFIEICLDTQQNVWIMLHSGSRNIGKELAEIHISIAKNLSHNEALPDKDLAVFLANTKEMAAYCHDLNWAQRYAYQNRELMLKIIKDLMLIEFPHIQFDQSISCHHNYLSNECHFGEKVFITRKGAINASKGAMGIIPGSMGAKSYIVKGLGNKESFESASHGAGRRMSRNAAKKHFNLADLKQQTLGVECRKDKGVLDEIPGCYKDIDKVIANQSDLVEVVYELKQVLCIKG